MPKDKTAMDRGIPDYKFFSYRTAMKVIRAYRDADPDLAGKPFKFVLSHMFGNSGWRPDESLAHRGIPIEWEWEFDRPKKEYAASLTHALLSRGRERHKHHPARSAVIRASAR